MKPLKEATSEFADLALDDQEPLHIIGSVQPHGVLIAFQTPSFTIHYVSENTQEYLGRSPASLLGQSLKQIFSEATVCALTALLQEDDLEVSNPLPIVLAKLPNGDAVQTAYLATAYRTNDVIVLELEPTPAVEEIQSNSFYDCLKPAILNIKQASTLTDLFQQSVQDIRELIGFDRVMLYRFDADHSGVVVAEAVRSDLRSYLGLHYPAIDVPPAARDLFTRRWLRIIPNVNADPVKLRSLTDTDAPLDLSQSGLRGVSLCHLEYLRNMGVTASMSIPVVDQNRLWGLIACHHSVPRLASYETRRMCELLGQLVSVEFVLRQERELNHYLEQIRQVEQQFRQDLLKHPNQIETVLEQNQTVLLNLVQAQGMAIASVIKLFWSVKPLPKPRCKICSNGLQQPTKKSFTPIA
ncbi:MAG: GAF domain-containing protein [Leptolyngbyaceae cyanobacterium RM2_2_4]|nr:GAF domain-containing protein [Leptolyngbyaceae cyanobacterium RM2_2_4]